MTCYCTNNRQMPWVHFVQYLDLGKSEKCASFSQIIRFMGKTCLKFVCQVKSHVTGKKSDL